MASDLRKSGIEVLGDVPWGAHFSQFYETKKDLLELLVPYFKAGLENNEYCLWIIAEPMTVEDALQALQNSVPDFQQYIQKKSIEILPYMNWFMTNENFDGKRLINSWLKKLDEAIARGYDGMRINGNETWLKLKGWDNFMEYEQGLDNALKNRRIIGLCTYPLSNSDGAMVLDVAHAHEAVIAKRKGRWEILEKPEIKKLKAELQQRSDELEQRVAERTKELKQVVDQLSIEVDERKRAEEEIKRQVELTTETIRTIPTMIWSILPDGRLDFVNQRWIDYTGLTLAEAMEEPTRIIHPEDLPRVMKKWEPDRDIGNYSEDEMRLRGADGQYRWFLVRTAPLRNKDGKIAKWYGVSIDIEDSKRAEDKLNMAYQRLSYHVGNTPLAVIEWDKDLDITRWSGQAEKIFGWKASEVLGRNRYDRGFPIVYKEDEENVEKIDYELMNGLVDRNFSLNRNYTKDGKVIYCEWYNSVLRDEQGKVITILSLTQDVTERKKAEEKLNQSYEEIRSLSEHLRNIREEERKYISREIHDELGQYLTILKLDAEILDEKLYKTEDDLAREKIKRLLENIDNMVLAIRRISLALRPSFLDDLGLTAAIHWHLNEYENSTGIKTSFTEPEEELDLPDVVKINLFRIFQESLTNAARHSGANELKVDLLQKDESLKLIINDNGNSFDANNLKKETMGIVGMKERVAMIGGQFEIQNEQGKGTTITVTVPLKTKPGES